MLDIKSTFVRTFVGRTEATPQLFCECAIVCACVSACVRTEICNFVMGDERLDVAAAAAAASSMQLRA